MLMHGANERKELGSEILDLLQDDSAPESPAWGCPEANASHHGSRIVKLFTDFLAGPRIIFTSAVFAFSRQKFIVVGARSTNTLAPRRRGRPASRTLPICRRVIASPNCNMEVP